MGDSKSERMVAIAQVLGASIAIIAAVLSCFGANVQKKVHVREDRLPENLRKHYTHRPFWWIGMCGVVLAGLGDFAALGLASQPLVASLGGSTTLIANVFVARFYHKNALYATDVLGVACVAAGAIFCAIKAAKQPELSSDEMRDQLTAEWMIVYLTLQSAVIVALLAGVASTAVHRIRTKSTEALLSPVFNRLEEQERRIAELEGHLSYVHSKLRGVQRQVRRVTAEVAESTGNLSNWGAFQDGASTCRTLPCGFSAKQKDPAHWADKYILAACAGAIGGLSVLFGSTCSRSLASEHLSAFADPFFYCYLIMMLVCVITQTSLLNQAMQLGDMMSVFPVFESFWISFGVLGGLVFYNGKLAPGAWEQAYGLIFMLAGTVCFLLHPDPQLRDRTDTLPSLSDQLAGLHTPQRSPMRSALAGDGDVSPLSQSEVNITTPPSRLSALANSRPALRAWAVEPEQQGTAPVGGL